MKQSDDPDSDQEIKEVLYFKQEWPEIARQVEEMLINECAPDMISAKFSKTLPTQSLVELYQKVYFDFSHLDNQEIKLMVYTQSLPKQEKTSFIQKSKLGKHYAPAYMGIRHLNGDLTAKDQMEMITHLIAQAYAVASTATETNISSHDHKTILAYNNLAIQLIKLLNEVKSGSSDTNIILERLASLA